ncbi:uncharacterized protein SETTUDRAFT_166456, partial [Exserohilum turcica Et28A]
MSEGEGSGQTPERLQTGVQQGSATSRLKRKASDDVEMVPASLLERAREKNSKLAAQVCRLKAEIPDCRKSWEDLEKQISIFESIKRILRRLNPNSV